MVEGFGENVAPTAAIRAILNSYPFSVGLLREILQNSDDAKATKQVFVLDRRSHGTKALYHPYLAATQGPALLAYNNELIHEDDWKALQNIHRSSKTADTSKIGKYGVGFRSCYHVTDTPHILSGSHLAILDPGHDFAEFYGVKVGGAKLNIEDDWKTYSDQIAAFDTFLPRSEWGRPFHGSIFRLPLRTSGGPISNKAVSPDEISALFRDFVEEELNVALLFLRNVTSIEVYEVDVAGKKTEIARVTIDRTPLESHGEYGIRKALIRTHILNDSSEKGEWRIVHAPFSEADAVDMLSERLGGNPTATLSQHKLSPAMDFAIPLNFPGMTRIGRLFTYLPLPLRTEFPVHINALFSLTQSRQNLRNGGEIGIVKNSDDHALTEWNRLLFEVYIPQVWGALLEALVKCDQIENVFDAWPRLQAEVQSGDYMYWRDMAMHVAQHALELPIWPVYGRSSPSHHAITSFLIADEGTRDDVLTALMHAGLLITQPPQYITDIIRAHSNVKLLSPEAAHKELLCFTSQVEGLDDADASILLAYLLSTSNCRCIVGLPLVPSVAGPRIILAFKDVFQKSHTLFNETEEQLFSAYDGKAVSLGQVPQAIRRVLAIQGPSILNLKHLDGSRVATYLDASPYASQSQEVATSDQIRWLNQFWDWIQQWASDSTFCNQYYLVPTTRSFERPTDIVFDPRGDNVIAELFNLLGVPVIDFRLNRRVFGALECLYPSSDIHALLRELPSTVSVKFSETQAKYFCDYLLIHLPLSCSQHNAISADTYLCSQLRSLPIYPVIAPSPDDAPQVRRTSIAANSIVRGVYPDDVPIFPQVDSVTYLDLRSIRYGILQYLDARYSSPLSISEMHDLMLQHFSVQSLKMQVAFVKYLDSNVDIISRRVLISLTKTEFVPATDGSLQMPKDLVDPKSHLASLFPGASSCLPDTTTPTLKLLSFHLRQLGLFITRLSVDIISDRVRFIASGDCTEPEGLACNLINTITDTAFDCRRLFRSSRLFLELEWIPTLEGLKNPPQSRDSFSHSGEKDLFDEVFSMITPNVHIGKYLRQAFGWDDVVEFEVLSQQLTRVLDGPEPPYEKVRKIVEEIGQRHRMKPEVASLHRILHGRRWVPTRNGTLESTPFALLGEEDLPDIGFHSVVYDSYRHPRMQAFLQEMGCAKRPSKATILDHLRVLHSLANEKTGDQYATQDLICLLTWLPPLLPRERTKLFVPDTNGAICPFNDVYYNDIGPAACLYDIGSNRLAHPRISVGLATDLGLKLLGLMGVHGQADNDLDLGEDAVATIRNILQKYTGSQLLFEFLANASDAGAKEFNILIDESRAPTSNLLSPRCRDFNNVPALVIHNDGIFTDDDFNGILRTGVGGKSDRGDTVGRFGLGALTMFHITEFATIVSRDRVLFLDPCRCHLPVDRAALCLPLSTVRKLYRDHLSPLIGLFGFEPPEDVNKVYSYKGTIFRLPTRSSKQFFDVEPISKETMALEDLVFHFKPLSSKCLFFTSVAAIRLFKRQYRTPQLLWSVTASRDQSPVVRENVSASTITISSSDSPNDQEWRVLSSAVDDLSFPPFISLLREKYRLRFSPVVQFAACSSPNGRHTLFSTLPLPISLDLPVHISGPFILSSDRRSIRLDEDGSLEATYNLWLLTVVIPTMYLCLLEDRALFADNAVYWPANVQIVPEDVYNLISTTVIDAVYQLAATSGHSIFRSKFHAVALSPSDAYLIFHLPQSVSRVLELIRPLGVAQLPSSVTRRLKRVHGGHVSLVTPKYVHQQMRGPAQFSASTLEFAQLQELVDFLIGDPHAFECLVGLQLLPLEDGSFAKFDRLSKSCFYTAPPQVVEKAVFKTNRLVHHGFATAKLLSVYPSLNVQEVTNENIGELLSDYVSLSPTLENTNPIIQTWNKNFWKVFALLSIPMSTIADYPLIPTLRPGHYLSAAYCKRHSVILANFSTQEWLSRCLSQMDFTIVNTASLPREARSSLSSPELSVGNVLALLFNRRESMVALFDSLGAGLRLKFTSWIYSHFVGKQRGFFAKHWRYSTLPLWRTADGSFRSAKEIQMLPKGVTIESVAPFASAVIVNHDLILESMGIQSPPAIRSMLNIPGHLEPLLDNAYQTLLHVLLGHSDQSPSIPVPNSQRLIQESNTLYSSRDDLFIATFGQDSERFVLPSFRKFEYQLEQFGLKKQRDLSLSMFKSCVEAFQNSSRGDPRGRAAVIFRIFCEDLPLRVSSDKARQWRFFNNLRFIPRNMVPQPLGSAGDAQYIAPHARNLPGVVSPNELVREEFQAIAWSQRALYDTEPDRRILMVHPDLGLPTVEEVVNHLAVLVTQVALNRPKDSRLLNHIEKTYQWLNDHAAEAQQFLRQKEDIALFLNVEDPTSDTEDWVWKKATHILLDNYDTGTLQHPREFLKGFRLLLVAAGAVIIDYGPDVPNRPEQTTDEDPLSNLSSIFDQMRKDRTCTDISFTCSPPDDEPLYAHRGYLAAYSSYFRKMFSGSCREARDASDTNPMLFRVPGFSRRCVNYVLDYAYTARVPDFKREDADIQLALEMLVLSHSWLMSGAQRALQDIIIKMRMVDPFNLDKVRATAQHTQSLDLIHHCEVYEMRNVTLVLRAREESTAAPHN